jgi:hypothetical protein
MNWVLEHLQLLIGAAAAIAYFLNRQRTAGREESEQAQRPAGNILDDQAERTRRVQEEIRRKIAERRGGSAEHRERQSPREIVPPLVRPAHVPPLDPFGGPMRRVVKKLEEAAAQLEERRENAEELARKAEAVRQANLAESLRELESARAVQERRLTEVLLAQKRRKTEMHVSAVDIGDVRSRLRNPEELRRAVILREILGPPVGLR